MIGPAAALPLQDLTMRSVRLLLILGLLLAPRRAGADPPPVSARYVILLIADGWSYKIIEATNRYNGSAPAYQSWTHYPMATFPLGGSYVSDSAWSDFAYVTSGYTDSAAAATALYTGAKTANGRISVNGNATDRLKAITEKAREQDKAVGAVTSVQISHATPGAWEAHNDARGNGYAIADEGLWGDPNTTGPATEDKHGGGHGPTLPPLDVLIGGGHPAWNSGYVNTAIRDKLAAESGAPGAFLLVERVAGAADGGSRLLAAAATDETTRLGGLFGGSGGNIAYRLADGSGHDPENPTLAEMTQAALTVLARDVQGFLLLVEGGAVDWAAHNNRLDQAIGEMNGFDAAVQATIAWVEAADTPTNWENTLVIVTGDHETGYLTAGPGVFAHVPLTATIDAATLALEKTVSGASRRASWEDVANPGVIDSSERVYWYWNSGNHANSLIPLYAKGVGAELFAVYATGADSVRGAYVDNTDVFKVMDAALPMPPAAVTGAAIALGSGDVLLQWPAVRVDVSGQPVTASAYHIYRGDAPSFRPGPATLLHSTAGLTHSDPGLPAAGSARYYTLLAASGPNSIGPAGPMLGVFSFPLTPGG